MSNLEVKKRTSEDVVCRKVPAELTPNTLVTADSGLTLFVDVDGQHKVTMKTSFTVYELLNPGKKNKLIGGNKEYKDAVIYALDQSSEFDAEWALAGPYAIPCHDDELDVDCNAVAFGRYYYRVESFFDFLNAFGKNEEITRDDIRELLRGETTGIINAVLGAGVSQYGVKACRDHLGEYADELKEKINKRLISKGLTVYNLVIEKLDYDMRHREIRTGIGELKVDVKAKKIRNEGERDDIKTRAEEANTVLIPIMNAANGINEKQQAAKREERARREKYCPRCGEANDISANYCYKCGEKLK